MNKTVVVGVCGGIAVYKAADVVSKLKKLGYNVKVIMTKSALEFMPTLTFQTLSNHPVATDLFEKITNFDVEHISLAKAADLFLVVPATANIVGKVANGIADDLLSTTIMATKAPVFFATAMNTNMYKNPIFQMNVDKLKSLGYNFISPESGFLACGDIGEGRLRDTAQIVEIVHEYLLNLTKTESTIKNGETLIVQDAETKALSEFFRGKKVVVTAGPTREKIDAVRYISNNSSGKQGYAIASELTKLGASVVLISGKVSLSPPSGVELIGIETTEDMLSKVLEHKDADIVIMAAAPSDYKLKQALSKKHKKEDGNLELELVETPDILKHLTLHKSEGQIVVGFAAETDNIIKNATKKLTEKNLDMIVANDVSKSGAGFDVETNIVSIITKSGDIESFPILSKQEVARKILLKICTL